MWMSQEDGGFIYVSGSGFVAGTVLCEEEASVAAQDQGPGILKVVPSDFQKAKETLHKYRLGQVSTQEFRRAVQMIGGCTNKQEAIEALVEGIDPEYDEDVIFWGWPHGLASHMAVHGGAVRYGQCVHYCVACGGKVAADTSIAAPQYCFTASRISMSNGGRHVLQ